MRQVKSKEQKTSLEKADLALMFKRGISSPEWLKWSMVVDYAENRSRSSKSLHDLTSIV
jgi:hypothetical protein